MDRKIINRQIYVKMHAKNDKQGEEVKSNRAAVSERVVREGFSDERPEHWAGHLSSHHTARERTF